MEVIREKAAAAERANVELLVKEVTAPVLPRDQYTYRAYLNTEEDTRKDVDEFYLGTLVSRIKNSYTEARKVFKGLANGNAPIATIQAPNARDRKRSLKPGGSQGSSHHRQGRNASLVLSSHKGGVSIVGKEQHARAARRRRRNGRRIASDRQRRREGSMLLVDASYLNRAFGSAPPKQYETLALERVHNRETSLVRYATEPLLCANDVPYFRMFDRLELLKSGVDKREKSRSVDDRNRNLNRDEYDYRTAGAGPPPHPQPSGYMQHNVRAPSPANGGPQQVAQQGQQGTVRSPVNGGQVVGGEVGPHSHQVAQGAHGNVRHQHNNGTALPPATRSDGHLNDVGEISPPPAPRLPTQSDLLHGLPHRREHGKKGSNYSVKARLLKLSGSSAAALKEARAEQSKIMSSLKTDSQFQYRHYYHIQQFFVAYFKLMHKMAQDSNAKDSSSRLTATLAYMYVIQFLPVPYSRLLGQNPFLSPFLFHNTRQSFDMCCVHPSLLLMIIIAYPLSEIKGMRT